MNESANLWISPRRPILDVTRRRGAAAWRAARRAPQPEVRDYIATWPKDSLMGGYARKPVKPYDAEAVRELLLSKVAVCDLDADERSDGHDAAGLFALMPAPPGRAEEGMLRSCPPPSSVAAHSAPRARRRRLHGARSGGDA